MKRLATLLAAPFIALSLSAVPATAALPVGAKAPAFTTSATVGGDPFTFSLRQALKKGPVVLYFYPAAFTKGCTVEAHEFAAAAADFEKQGATLIGLSADPIDQLAKFAVHDCNKAFPIGTATMATIKAYDVVLPQKTTLSNRTSFVISPNGKIVYVLSDLSPDGHVTGTLAAVKAWRAAHPAKG